MRLSVSCWLGRSSMPLKTVSSLQRPTDGERRGPSLGLSLRYLQEPLHPPGSHSPHHSTTGSGRCSGRPSSGSAPEGSLPFQLRLKCHSDTSAWKREKQQWPFLTLQQLVMKMTKVPTRTDVYTWCLISSQLSHVFM